jgi:hypothetical protein
MIIEGEEGIRQGSARVREALRIRSRVGNALMVQKFERENGENSNIIKQDRV